MQTRRDYIAISDILNKNIYYIQPSIFENLVGAFADYMLADNPRFDRDRFIDACYGVAK